MDLRIELNTSEALRDITASTRAVDRANWQTAEDASGLFHRELRLYPAQRPPANPKRPYIRTLTLKSSWHRKAIRREGGAVIGEVASSGALAPYNVWVQKADMQARIHRGMWRNTDANVVEQLRGRIARIAQERLRQNLAGLGR